MRIADADGLIKHFENVVDVKFFTPANVITIIKTFSGEVKEGHAYTFRSEDNKLIVTDLTEKKKLNEIVGGNFKREELESWLYEIAGNNMDNEFGTYCEELISRLDGFERFVVDRRVGGTEP